MADLVVFAFASPASAARPCGRDLRHEQNAIADRNAHISPDAPWEEGRSSSRVEILSSLSVFHVDLCSESVNRGPDRAIYGCFVFAFPHPLSASGATTLAACSAVLIWAIWPTAFLSAQLSQISEQNGASRSLSRWTPRCFGLVIPRSSIPGVL